MRKVCFVFLGLFFLVFISMNFVSALSLSVSVPEKYSGVVAGEKFYFEIEIKFPENPGRQDLRINYQIVNEEGEVIAHSRVLKAVETQASFIDSITIPENTKNGFHIIKVGFSDYADLQEDVSASFFVISPEIEQIRLYFFILLGVIVLVGILVLINIFLNKKIK